MREQVVDLWEVHKSPLAVAGIPTNGVTSSGRLVMGAGVALQARERFPGIDKRLGDKITSHDGENKVFYLEDIHVFTFPTKLDWDKPATKWLIDRSAHELRTLAVNHPDLTFYLPRPGCGLGRLDYRDVRPLLLCLPDNVIVITNKKD